MPSLRLLALCLFPFFVPVQATADLTYDIRDDVRFGRILSVVIGGTIKSGDRDALLGTRDIAATADLKMAILGSDGGDLNAAMEMGRYLRAMEFTAIVLPNTVCYSACVFLLAGGVDKKVQGDVGIHRPYFTTSTAGSTGEAIKAVKLETEAYFEEMNIPTRLAEDMFSIEPANMRVLSEAELRDYRLNSKDYAAQEADTIGMADQLGCQRRCKSRPSGGAKVGHLAAHSGNVGRA